MRTVFLATLVGALAVAAGLALASSGPPMPTITSHPASPTNAISASFSFTDSQSKVTFLCSLDGTSYSACSSPKTYSGLAAGAHTFRVEAKDTSGHTSDPASFTWTIDLTPPALTAINRADANPTKASPLHWTVTFSKPVKNVAASNFGFTTSNVTGTPSIGSVSPTSGSAPQASWTVTVSTAGMTGQNNGSIGLNLTSRGSIQDAAGNPLSTSGFTGQAYTFDTTPPPTPSIAAHPANPTNQTSASFSFTDTETGVSFVCKLDGGAYAACTSPKSYSVAQGTHTFSVEAIDAAGNAGPAASYIWVVDTTPPPNPKITSGPPNPSSSTSATFTFTDSEAGGSFTCKLDSGAWTACTSPTTYNGLNANNSHEFSVRAVDAAGNQSGETDFSWKISANVNFTISGNAPSLLYPGAPAIAIPVKLTNPNSVPIYVTSLAASLLASGLPTGCESTWFQIAPSNISATQTVQVPANGSVTLPAQGAGAPTVQMIDSHTKQNACIGANLTFSYSGSAHS